MSCSRVRFKSPEPGLQFGHAFASRRTHRTPFVPYEDRRIEMLGIVQAEMIKLDNMDSRYRVNYFLRAKRALKSTFISVTMKSKRYSLWLGLPAILW